jgi:phytoene dehydrogenase-like protein
MSADAVVIGSGPNGLVAANLLADQGWRVTVLEEQDEPGGAVKSGDITGVPGHTSDLFSAFYPLSAASGVIAGLRLGEHGLRWCRSEGAVAHPLPDGSCAFLSADIDETTATLDAYAPGDGDGWRRLHDLYERVGPQLISALMTPFPPIRPGLGIATAMGRDLVRFARFGILPVRRLAEETFEGAGGANLLAGNALHADLTPDSSGGGLFGWLLCMLGQDVGFPVPQGGAGNLTRALLRRLESRGGEIHTGQRVVRVLVRDGRAVGVRTELGDEVGAERAVLADTGAPQLYLDLVPREHVPPRVVSDLEHFQYDASTIKVDWALDAPIPWTAPDARRAGTIHVSDGLDHLTQISADIECGRIPADPFLIVGQYSMVDPSRSPAGKETAWAYTHVPQSTTGDVGGELSGRWDEQETERFAERVEAQIERLAPGFRGLIRGRHVFNPQGLEAANRNLVGGAVNSGTAQLHQQVVFRPLPGLGRPETPVRGLYLASASAHPGGGVHGGPGNHAARAALAHDRLSSPARRLLRAF